MHVSGRGFGSYTTELGLADAGDGTARWHATVHELRSARTRLPHT